MKKLIANLASCFPLSIYKSSQWSNLIIANYHSILNADVDPAININPYRTCEEMEDDFRFFKKHYQVITTEDFLQYIKKGKALKSKSLLITFDDGLRLMHNLILPIFKQQQVTAILFLNNNFIDNADLHFERKANVLIQHIEGEGKKKAREAVNFLESKNIYASTAEQQIRFVGYHDKYILDELASLVGFSFDNYLLAEKPYLDSQQIQDFIDAGCGIGAHSLDHPNYLELSLEDQVEQTINSVNDITERFKLNYKLFAFPYGNDKLISKEFFTRISEYTDATFGIQGMLRDVIPTHFQRFGVERSRLPIKKALSFEYFKALAQRATGKGIISRY